MSIVQLYELRKDANSSHNNISVTHAKPPEERAANKKLKDEARTLTAYSSEQNVIFVVRGPPWDRKVTKVKEKN